MLRGGHFSSNLLEEVAEELGIPEYALLFDNTSLDMGGEVKVAAATNGNGNKHHNEHDHSAVVNHKGSFPGRDLYFSLARVEAARQLCLKSSQESDFAVHSCVENMSRLREELLQHLNQVLYKPDVDEIMATKFDHIIKNLKRRLEHSNSNKGTQ
jgi:hypothetical protein